MPAASSREPVPSAGLLSIGQVLARLASEFPGLSASKLRFLEEQGLIAPSRTESRYRKYSPADLDRVRLVLTLQRDRFLPHSVIRDYLADIDEGRDPADPARMAPPPTIVPAPRRYRRADLLAAAGAAPQLLNDAISTGMIAAADSYGEQTVTLLRAIVALDRHGIEPRHLRALKLAAEREVALMESALSSLLRRTDAASRARASELAPELAARFDEVRSVYVKAALGRALG